MDEQSSESSNEFQTNTRDLLELKTLREANSELQNYYMLLRVLRSDLEKITENVSSITDDMASRKSMMHPRVEELGRSSPTSSSPLRRRSSVAPQKSPSTSLTENDDEAELRIRRIENKQPPVAQSTDRRKSLGLSFVAQMSHPQIAEKVQQCIQLSAENKINVKNAFSLQMIDFMTYMIKKRDANMNNLQVASTSLDVSTKIYGLRVDGVYADILKMSGGMDKHDKQDAQRNGDDEDGGGDGDEDSQARDRAKKKRKSKQKIIATSESLRGPTETVNLTSSMMGAGDTQTTDMLYLATIPYHANRGAYLHLYDEHVLDTANSDQRCAETAITWPKIKNFDVAETCSSFVNFEMLGWSVDDEKEETTPSEATFADNDLHFDLEAGFPDDEEVSNVGRNYFDIDDEEAVAACERVVGPAANIVDFTEILGAATKPRNMEYSYFNDNMDIVWAGPSHWKIRHPTKNLASSQIIGRCDQEPIRRRREVVVAYENEPEKIVSSKYGKTRANRARILSKTAKTNWNEEKITLPQDMHCDEDSESSKKSNAPQIYRFYLRRDVVKSARPNDGNGTEVTDDIGNYDYNNEHDTTDYCPNIACDDEPEVEGVGDSAPGFDENGDFPTQAFTGDNLVELPKMTNEIILGFSQRAKRIDMQQLKKCMWKKLKELDKADGDNANSDECSTAENRDDIGGSVKFSDVYEQLPKTLSKNNVEALSLPVAFISLLHLANEKTLAIESVDDKSDLIISQG